MVEQPDVKLLPPCPHLVENLTNLCTIVSNQKPAVGFRGSES